MSDGGNSSGGRASFPRVISILRGGGVLGHLHHQTSKYPQSPRSVMGFPLEAWANCTFRIVFSSDNVVTSFDGRRCSGGAFSSVQRPHLRG